MAARMAGVILLLAVAIARGQTTCSAKVAVALTLVKGDGSSVACCAEDSAHCSLSLTGDCSAAANQPNVIWCLGAGESKSCVLSYSNDTDAPCGSFFGSSGATYGISPVASGYPNSFSNPIIQEALVRNWDHLSVLSEASLCTASDDRLAANPSQPHVGTVTMLSQNPCNTGEFNWKCYGTKTDGLCMVYANTTSTSDTGEYFLVNLDPSAPKSVSSISSTTGSAISSSTSSFSISTTSSHSGAVASQTADPGAVSKGKPNLAAIVVPVVLAVLLLGLLMLWFLRRRAARHKRDAHGEAPVPYAHSMVEMSSNAAAIGSESVYTDGQSGLQAWTTSSRSRLRHHASQSSYGQPISPSTFDIPNDAPPAPAFVGKRGMAAADTNRAFPPSSDLPPYSPPTTDSSR
ncbi:hypothetical protein BKA62DRAFT_693674 [Auriculariales sp. MPI-PUGE-AT-0066]|nr:hypothetical protein BKA62DRAFT_693674 [Auriculariales sp. MPI-PUGE-AT-0066]